MTSQGRMIKWYCVLESLQCDPYPLRWQSFLCQVGQRSALLCQRCDHLWSSPEWSLLPDGRPAGQPSPETPAGEQEQVTLKLNSHILMPICTWFCATIRVTIIRVINCYYKWNLKNKFKFKKILYIHNIACIVLMLVNFNTRRQQTNDDRIVSFQILKDFWFTWLIKHMSFVGNEAPFKEYIQI